MQNGAQLNETIPAAVPEIELQGEDQTLYNLLLSIKQLNANIRRLESRLVRLETKGHCE